MKSFELMLRASKSSQAHLTVSSDYSIIEEDLHQCTAVRENLTTWKMYIMKCLPCFRPENNMVAIRMNVILNPTKCTKTVVIRCLCGEKKEFLKFSTIFKKNLLSHQSRLLLSKMH